MRGRGSFFLKRTPPRAPPRKTACGLHAGREGVFGFCCGRNRAGRRPDFALTAQESGMGATIFCGFPVVGKPQRGSDGGDCGEDFFLEKKKPSPHPSQKNRLRPACRPRRCFWLLLWAKSGRMAARFRVDRAGVRDGSDDLLRLSGGRKSSKGMLLWKSVPSKNADLDAFRWSEILKGGCFCGTRPGEKRRP